MAEIIPLQPVPSQQLTVSLANQTCQILLNQRLSGMYLDLYVQNTLIIGGVQCENLNRIVRDSYLGFSGDLVFIDSQGNDDPVYTGLGSRFNLAYLTAAEVPEDN